MSERLTVHPRTHDRGGTMRPMTTTLRERLAAATRTPELTRRLAAARAARAALIPAQRTAEQQVRR